MKPLDPGWYPNPELGKSMYWDGKKWLDIPIPTQDFQNRIGEPYSKTSSLAIIAVLMDILLPPFGWYLGFRAKNQIKQSGGQETGIGLARFAIWFGGFGTLGIPVLVALLILGSSAKNQTSEPTQQTSTAAITSATPRAAAGDCFTASNSDSCIVTYSDGSVNRWDVNPVGGDTAEPEYSDFWHAGELFALKVAKKYKADWNRLLIEQFKKKFEPSTLADNINPNKSIFITDYFNSLKYKTFSESCARFDHDQPNLSLMTGSFDGDSVAESGCWAALGYNLSKSPPFSF